MTLRDGKLLAQGHTAKEVSHLGDRVLGPQVALCHCLARWLTWGAPHRWLMGLSFPICEM